MTIVSFSRVRRAHESHNENRIHVAVSAFLNKSVSIKNITWHMDTSVLVTSSHKKFTNAKKKKLFLF